MNAVAMSCGFEEILVGETARKKKTPEETFGERLARLRKARGYTQTELGEMVGVSQRMMTYYERAADHPPAYLLPKLAQALGVTADELLGLRPVEAKPVPRNTRLWRKLREIEKLPAGERKAVMKILDGLLVRQKLQSQGTR
jgi:transcriptional regulator with XRE-family HTH domain